MSRSSSHSEQLPPEFRSELDALLTTLELSEGTFSLSLAVCNSPVLRDRLIEKVRQQRSDIEQLDLPAGLVDVYGFVKEHAQPDLSTGLFLTGLEASISSRDEDNQSLRSLNASRDLWEKQFSRPVILWLPEYAARELTTEAVDFNRYLSHRFGFAGDAPVLPVVDRNLPGAVFAMATQLSGDEKEARIAELRSRLRQAERSESRLLPHLTNWTRELSYLLAISGEREAAQKVCRDLLPVALSQSDELASALLWGQIADVLHSQGKLDETLRIHREEELPRYVGIGDAREEAVTLGKIADVLQDQGKLDDAIRIRYEHELPVYDRLGDVREAAIAKGKIADVLGAWGELDEALRIFRDEVLPAFVRMGDIRHVAVAWGRIADVLQARGELDEALRIRRDEELPVYERLGDVREIALVWGKIADVLQARGDLNEAFRIRRDKQITVFERLGATLDLIFVWWSLAENHLARNAPGDRDEAAELLRQAHAAAEKMGIPEADRIREIQEREGF